jgi:alpha-1,2-mannosyltransferase
VFNYWEPTHYINHGHGLQTWEYSPEYAIRSWTYVGLHAVVIWVGRLLPFVNGKVAEFYLLRVFLALICAVCQTRLYATISRTMNPRVAIYFLMVMISSPGMYHASPAYLPSSFAMYTTMLGFSAFMDWQGGIRTAQGIMWFGIGSVLGWPFAGALVLPFLAEEVLLASITGDLYDGFRRVLDGTVRSLIVLVCFFMWFLIHADTSSRAFNYSSIQHSSTRKLSPYHSTSSFTMYSAEVAKALTSMVLSHGTSTFATLP